jgi:hypothetical protein
VNQDLWPFSFMNTAPRLPCLRQVSRRTVGGVERICQDCTCCQRPAAVGSVMGLLDRRSRSWRLFFTGVKAEASTSVVK